MRSGANVLVTGASGMVGFHAVRYLLDQGYCVTGLVRKTSNVNAINELVRTHKLTLVTAELDQYSLLLNAMSGIDVVVHAAGAVSPLGLRQDIFATNVNGTKACLEAAIEASVKHFIYISSLSVITGQKDQFGLTEDAPLRYCGEAYADSKVEAEKLVMSESLRGNISVTSLRPGFIYGPGERAWMPRLINSLVSGKAMLIDGGKKETNLIYIENLCGCIGLSLLNPRAYGQVFNLTDGERISKKQLFDAICDLLDLPKVTRSIPGPIAKLFCEVVSSVAPYLPRDVQGNLSRYSRAAFRLAGVNQGFDISKAERELGYSQRIAFREGMKETLQHFQVETRGWNNQYALTCRSIPESRGL